MFDSIFPKHWTTLQRLMWLKTNALARAVYEIVTGNPVTFTAKKAPLRQLKVAFDYDANGITGTEIWIEGEYDPSAYPTMSVTFPTTIYGGTYDAISGVLISTYAADGTLLPTPVTYQLDTNVLNSINGVNYVWSDGDEVEVCYVVSRECPIVGVGQAGYMILFA